MEWEEHDGWVYGGYAGTVELDSPAVIVNGRTLVPIRAISEILEYDVSWNEETKMLPIDD